MPFAGRRSTRKPRGKSSSMDASVAPLGARPQLAPGTCCRCNALGALMRRAVRLHEIECRVDETDVREALREVADEPLRVRVVLFREEPQVVAQRENAFEQP